MQWWSSAGAALPNAFHACLRGSGLARQVLRFTMRRIPSSSTATAMRRPRLPVDSEGFGLPLVEALGYGLRVFASDIPIFREIGEGFVSYFPLDDPEILTGKLRVFASKACSMLPARSPISLARMGRLCRPPAGHRAGAGRRESLGVKPLRIGWSATLACDPATRDLPDGIGVYTRELAAANALRDDVTQVPVVIGTA